MRFRRFRSRPGAYMASEIRVQLARLEEWCHQVTAAAWPAIPCAVPSKRHTNIYLKTVYLFRVPNHLDPFGIYTYIHMYI